MEKLVNKRLIWHLETSNFFPEEQCGFRQNHWTIDTFLKLHTDIINAKCNKQHLCLIALDIEKAYDMAWRNRILKIIQRENINGKMFFFEKLPKQPHNIGQSTKWISNIHTTENSIPQGSVISVTMFLIAINDIFCKIPNPTKHIIFADDCYIGIL